VLEYKINKKKADRNKSNAPRSREEREIWVHYTYYYYPNIEVYQQVETGMWFYQEGNQWRSVSELPVKLRRLQMHNTYKVKLHYTGCNPTLFHRTNKRRFPAMSGINSKKRSEIKDKKTRTRSFYIPVNRSDLVAYDLDAVEMNFDQN
jgi:hypothetical protein